MRWVEPALAVLAAETNTSPARDLGFGLVIAGVFGLWLGGANFVARRLAARRWGPLGDERAIWFKAGFFFAPNWLSTTITVLGAVLLLVGAAIWTIWSATA
jgi:hypothetical protein